MVKKEDRTAEGQSVYEFQSLNPTNGFYFTGEKSRKYLESSLKSEQIFKLHEAKFLIWEKFGFVKILLGKATFSYDSALISHVTSAQSFCANGFASPDEIFDVPGFLYLPFKEGHEEAFKKRWEKSL